MAITFTLQAREDLMASAPFAASLANGFIRFYDGVRPAGPSTALSGNTLLASCGLAATALIAGATDGVVTFGTISNDVSVDASGTPTFARFFASNGTTAIMDMSVGTSGTDIIFDTLPLVAGGIVAVSSLTLTLPG